MDTWIQAFLPAFFGAVLSALGMGGGGVLLIYLTAFQGMEQFTAQGINLIFFLPIAAVSLTLHIRAKLVDWRLGLLLLPAGIAGVFLGASLAGRLPDELLRRLFAGLLAVIGLRELWGALRPQKRKKRPGHGKPA